MQPVEDLARKVKLIWAESVASEIENSKSWLRDKRNLKSRYNIDIVIVGELFLYFKNYQSKKNIKAPL